MLERLKKDVYESNMQLIESGLVKLTWGNASGIDREKGLIVIKPSGVDYKELSPDKMVVVDLKGNTVEGNLKPSSDTPTHVVLYNNFQKIGGIVHTHSTWATIWAQSYQHIPCLGTTHADHFYNEVPCTRFLTSIETEKDYEVNTGKVILETFTDRDYISTPGVLVAGHGPFTWGEDEKEAVKNGIILEEIAKMAYFTIVLNRDIDILPKHIIKKHYNRKHGKNAYYGQDT